MAGILLFFSLLQSCSSANKVAVSSEQFAAMYNPSELSLNADYRLYHISDDMTSLYIRIYPGELLFNQANEDNEYRAIVTLDYGIFELDENSDIIAKIDSSRISLKLSARDEGRKAYFANKVLNIPAGKKYLIRIEAKDQLRGSVGLKHLFIDKKSIYSAQNFSVLSAQTRYPKFLNYFVPGELFRLYYRDFGVDSIYIDMYTSSPPTPRPAITLESPSSFPRVPDSTMTLQYRDSMIFTLPEKGMYHFRVDSSKEEGISLHNFGENYPKITSDVDLMEPLFYISTNAEYKNLRFSENLKLAVDNFWLQRTNSMERSRELIRVYYNRVLYSNLYFTADKEGWETDRGMIFILFGPPDRMRDTGADQRWYYSNKRQSKVIEFVFKRMPNNHTNQDLVWQKNIETMQYWSAAVNSWRSGKVYTIGR